MAAVPGSTSRVTIEQCVGGEADPSDLWRPVKFDEGVKHRKSETREVCFGCAYGSGFEAGDDEPALKGLWRLFTDHYGKDMSNETIADAMHAYFEREIRQPMLDAGATCPPWPPKRILEHLECHVLEPTVHCATSIQELKRIASWLRDEVRVRNLKNGTTRVDLRVLRSLLDVEKQLQSLYSAKCSRQLFYSDVLKLDDRRVHQQK